MTRIRRLAGGAAFAMLMGPLLVACGSGDSSGAAAPRGGPAVSGGSTTGAAPPAGSARNKTLFDVDVVRVSSGQTTNLEQLSKEGKPTLLWFWAPHCSICRAEAPKVLAFAAEHGDDIQIIGLGAQDSYAQAEGFLEDTGTQGLEMVWDKTGSSWVHYEVTNQPTVIVVGADGEQKKKLFRDFDEDGILQAAGLT